MKVVTTRRYRENGPYTTLISDAKSGKEFRVVCQSSSPYPRECEWHGAIMLIDEGLEKLEG